MRGREERGGGREGKREEGERERERGGGGRGKGRKREIKREGGGLESGLRSRQKSGSPLRTT